MDMFAIKLRKCFTSQCCRNFTHSVTAEIRHDYGITLLHPVIPIKGRRQDKLIRLLFGIRCIDIRFRAQCCFWCRLSDGSVAQFHSPPTVVSIHRIKSPADCRNSDILIADRFDQCQIGFTRSGADITAIRDHMQKDFFSSPLCKFRQADDLCDMRMHSAITQQSYQMNSFTFFKCLVERFIGFDRTIFQSQRDFDQILIEYSSASDRHMAYFRVTHLSIWQTDTQAGSSDQRFRSLCEQVVKSRFLRIPECIADTVWLTSYAICYYQ